MSESYSGQQFVGIDLHRRRSVIVRMTTDGDPLECIRISNDVERLTTVMARARTPGAFSNSATTVPGEPTRTA